MSLLRRSHGRREEGAVNMETCKECAYHDSCKANDMLCLTLNDLYELEYLADVGKLCVSFKRANGERKEQT